MLCPPPPCAVQDDTPVKERGPPRTLSCERSFPPTADPAALRAACRELAQALLPRLLEVRLVGPLTWLAVPPLLTSD